MKFNHLKVPGHWEHYWSRHPEGYTILEALISWVSQVDDMVDNVNNWNEYLDTFVATFDKELQQTVTDTLSDWQQTGFLEVVISEALQWQLTDYIATNEADKLSLNEQLTQIAINLKTAGAKGDGVTDDTDILQQLASVEGNTIYVPQGEFMITSPIYLAKNVKIYGHKGKSIIKIPSNSSTDIFKVNALCDVSGLTIDLSDNPTYSGNVFEISPYTLDINSPNQLNTKIHNIDFNFYKFINWDPRYATAILIFADNYTGSDPKYGKSGFWDITTKDISVSGRCKYVIRQYEKRNVNTDVWLTGVYHDNMTIESSAMYGFFGSQSEETMSDRTITDGTSIWFNNWQMQCSQSKNMFFFGGPSKTLKNYIAWDWGNYALQDANGVRRKPIAVWNGHIGRIYSDLEHDVLENRSQILGRNDVHSQEYYEDVYKIFNNYLFVNKQLTPYKPYSGVKLLNNNDASNELFYPKWFLLGRKKMKYEVGTTTFNAHFTLFSPAMDDKTNDFKHEGSIRFTSSITSDGGVFSHSVGTHYVKFDKLHRAFKNIYYNLIRNDAEQTFTIELYLRQDWFYGRDAYIIANNSILTDSLSNRGAFYFDMKQVTPYNSTGYVNIPILSETQMLPITPNMNNYDIEGSYAYHNGELKVKAHWEREWRPLAYRMGGTTANRPTVKVYVGDIYFDTTLGKPVWCKQYSPTIVWVDATGATV